MSLVKMLGTALLSCIVLTCMSANAQQVPVSCTWSVVSSYGPPDNSWRDIVRQCKESNGTLVATQSFRGFANGNVSNCSLSLASNISYTGACITPSFYRTTSSSSSAQSSSAASSVSACATPGLRVHGGCANSYTPALLTQANILARCGAGCTLQYQEVGWTSACPYSGQVRSPEFGLYCN